MELRIDKLDLRLAQKFAADTVYYAAQDGKHIIYAENDQDKLFIFWDSIVDKDNISISIPKISDFQKKTKISRYSNNKLTFFQDNDGNFKVFCQKRTIKIDNAPGITYLDLQKGLQHIKSSFERVSQNNCIPVFGLPTLTDKKIDIDGYTPQAAWNDGNNLFLCGQNNHTYTNFAFISEYKKSDIDYKKVKNFWK